MIDTRSDLGTIATFGLTIMRNLETKVASASARALLMAAAARGGAEPDSAGLAGDVAGNVAGDGAGTTDEAFTDGEFAVHVTSSRGSSLKVGCKEAINLKTNYGPS